MSASWPVFKVGSRSSRLALAQTGEAIATIRRVLPSLDFEGVRYSSPGDRDPATDLRASAYDFFTRDLHEAVLAGAINCAVHSAKDLEDSTPEGVDWFWLPYPADPRDVVVLRHGEVAEGLGQGGVAGVSSQRREEYCLKHYPHLRPKSVRGTIEERLYKLDAGEYDLLIMAAAGLQRLGLEARVSEWIPVHALAPPDGQGHLALTFRVGDARFLRLRSLFIKPVVFVGAGPGGRELCTLAGAAALEECEVCLYDALVDASLLELIPPGAVRISVGKRCGRHPVDQDEICRLLARHARRGRRVVRLKGGDPGLFGRLGEEIDFLESMGLPYRVISGVSGLNAATTGTGLLLTRRGMSRAFMALTPRDAEGKFVPLSLMDRRNVPLVFFMAGCLIREVAADLLGKGYNRNLPVAVVSNAGMESQSVLTGNLGNMSEGVAPAAGLQPVLLIVGETAAQRFLYRAAGSALKGMRVLITCSAGLQDRVAALVAEWGGVPLRRPMIRLEPDESARTVLAAIHEFDWLILTSPSAVSCLVRILDEIGTDWRVLPKIIVSGPHTAAQLRKHRLAADVVADLAFGTEGLLRAAQSHLRAGSSVLRCRSDQADDRISLALRENGIRVTDCVLYRNSPVHYDRMPDFEAVIFTSGSAVRAFVANWGSASLADRLRIAIGPPTAAVLEEYGQKATVMAPEATSESAVRALAATVVGKDLRMWTEKEMEYPGKVKNA